MKQKKGILSYNELEFAREDFFEGEADPNATLDAEALSENYITIIDSHMALQSRNEKLRIQNARLIKMVTDAKRALEVIK